MTSEVSGSVRALLMANSVEEAQLAAAELIDLTLDGGAAISSDALGVVEEMSRIGEPEGLGRHGQYVFSVLIAIARWLGVWARAFDTGGGDEFHTRALDEAKVQRRLAQMARRELVGPGESAELRSLWCRFRAAATSDVDATFAYVLSALAGGERRLQLSAVQALGVLMLRADSSTSRRLLAELGKGIRLDDADVRVRLANSTRDIASKTWDENHRSLSALVGFDLPAPNYPADMWPSELL